MYLGIYSNIEPELLNMAYTEWKMRENIYVYEW